MPASSSPAARSRARASTCVLAPAQSGRQDGPEGHLHDLRRQQPDAAPGRRRPQVLCRQGHRRSAGGRRDRGDGGRVSEREPVGAHQLRSLPLPRVETVLPHRDHLVGDQHAAADGPDPARRPLGRRRRQGDDRAEGLHGQARRLGARRRAPDWLRARRPRPPLGGRSAHLSRCARPKARGGIAS